jgi:hypothetical protein
MLPIHVEHSKRPEKNGHNTVYIRAFFFCVGVMYPGECDTCDVTLSDVTLSYIDIEGTRLSSEISHTRTDLTA